MNYPEYKSVSYAEIADEILKFWQDNDIFNQSVEIREGKETFTFFEGPPSANGTPGIHHVMARTIKDIFCRYKTLQGFQVKRKGGWDTHGLPVELQVEKELGITKDDIGKKISVAEYNKKCRETVMRFTSQWDELTEKMGYWVDLENPYITYENKYIESVWYLLKELYKKGLLYKGYTIQPYSPAAGTGLSSHELNQPGTYHEVKDTSMTAQFKVINNEKSAFLFEKADSEEVFILAWTTTPWTLPSNAALTVGKNIEYALVKTFNPYTYEAAYVVLAKDLIGKYFSEKGKDGDFEGFAASDKKVNPWSILTTFKGSDLEGIDYEQLMPYVQPESPAFRVITGDFVTTEDGTGVVHTAPTFGADDFRVAQQNGIPAIMVKDETGKDVPLVDKRGRFVKEVTDYASEYVKEAYLTDEEKEAERQKQGRDKYLSVDERIAIKLKTENRAFNVQKFDHPYPHCWRTDKPVLYYPLDSWFIKTTAMKDRLAELNTTINWKPESTGTGRFGNWLENLVDWNLSRSRFWGTPLPIWRNDDGEEICIGSIAELEEGVRNALDKGHLTYDELTSNHAFLDAVKSETMDLHRPFVDEVYLVSATGKTLYREPDLIDVWFDSGAMPYAQWHYPFENQDIFDKSYPADFISEGVDQTRGWFFTLHAIAGMLFDSVAFKNVVSTGLVLDKNGNKMSKRLGNAVDPFETLKNYGADPTRWYMITNAQPWDNLKFDLAGITEVRNKFFGTLTNTYNFFALYSNLDGYTATGNIDFSKTTELDRWILSRLQTLVKEVGESYETYEPTKAARAIQDYVCDQLSNWYVRLGRRRFWNPSAGEAEKSDKQAAYETLAYCLKTVAQLMSPVAPFYADWLYKNLSEKSDKVSVHLSDFPVVQESWINEELETSMELAQRISSMVHSIRKSHRIKVRQPLSKILVPVLSEKTREQIRHVDELIKTEVNIKAVEYLDDASGVLSKKVKPNFKTLGPKFGKDMKAVAAAISELNGDQLKTIEAQGFIDLPVGKIAIEDVEILTEDLPGYLTAQDGGLTVALDVSISEELKNEGIARDFVNRVQNYRKDNGFEVVDKISIRLENNNEELIAAISANQAYISQEVQAVSLDIVDTLAEKAEIEMDEFVLLVEIKVV
ncbi:isoleucine--tRNA ligase [Emticicia sp. CRIBPO]|uniref:isoleucine--tRNA ligase n=1 Tax=Emticicia sp. CRIBPO TaxID=2683258 RepID=UPI0014124FF4|nr:isoleucine--tRNA ligase [Emticicia sp. CRIBPO]NBA89047.1 isoleucine--tRNA ligase [Emticicia sp. CRIBPO]